MYRRLFTNEQALLPENRRLRPGMRASMRAGSEEQRSRRSSFTNWIGADDSFITLLLAVATCNASKVYSRATTFVIRSVSDTAIIVKEKWYLGGLSTIQARSCYRSRNGAIMLKGA